MGISESSYDFMNLRPQPLRRVILIATFYLAHFRLKSPDNRCPLCTQYSRNPIPRRLYASTYSSTKETNKSHLHLELPIKVAKPI